MKKLFIFILSSLFFMSGGGVVAYSQEKNKLCPNVDLLNNIANEFTNIDLTKQPNKCNLDFNHVNIDLNSDVNKLQSLIKYYDITIQYLYTLNCLESRSKVYIEYGFVMPYNLNTSNFLELKINFLNSHNFLTRYNNELLNNGVSCIE